MNAWYIWAPSWPIFAPSVCILTWNIAVATIIAYMYIWKVGSYPHLWTSKHGSQCVCHLLSNLRIHHTCNNGMLRHYERAPSKAYIWSLADKNLFQVCSIMKRLTPISLYLQAGNFCSRWVHSLLQYSDGWHYSIHEAPSIILPIKCVCRLHSVNILLQ